MAQDQFNACVATAYEAFEHNAVVYQEETRRAERGEGARNVAAGAMASPFMRKGLVR